MMCGVGCYLGQLCPEMLPPGIEGHSYPQVAQWQSLSVAQTYLGLFETMLLKKSKPDILLIVMNYLQWLIWCQ